MSRSGYTEDSDDNWALIRWRGAVRSAIKGRRGQSLLKEMLAAFDAMPEKKLIARDLEKDGCVCSLGAVGKARGLDMSKIDPEDREKVTTEFGIPWALAAEIVYMNDEFGSYWSGDEKPEVRFSRMRAWVQSEIINTEPSQ